MRDIHSDISIANAFAAAVLAATTTGATIDLQNYDAAELVLSIGVGGITFTGANKLDFVVQHSDDGSAWTTVADADLLGVSGTTGGIVKSLQAAYATAGAHRFGYKGGRRYVRCSPTFSGTHATGTALAGVWLRGRGFSQPEANQA